jgi:hypothetical protein
VPNHEWVEDCHTWLGEGENNTWVVNMPELIDLADASPEKLQRVMTIAGWDLVKIVDEEFYVFTRHSPFDE